MTVRFLGIPHPLKSPFGRNTWFGLIVYFKDVSSKSKSMVFCMED